MKKIKQLCLALVLGGTIQAIQAQQDGFGGPPGGGKFPVPPIMKALDVNGDGVIDSNEMANASSELLTLDKNGDGKLSTDELKFELPTGPDGQPMTPPGGKIPTLPVMKALDTNADGELFAEEIANAPAALKTLDKNGDGKLTREEIMPQMPGGFGGPPSEN